MKLSILISVLSIVLLIPQLLSAQKIEPSALKQVSFGGCPENSDKRYDRKEVFKKFIEILYYATPEQARPPTKPIIIKDRPGGFSVWDLTDTSNRDVAFLGECVNFIEGHIYHFIYDRYPFSVSHIAILEQGKIKVFKSLSCPEGIDDYKEMIVYLEAKLKNDKNKDDILTRVKNFRRYFYYKPTDTPWYVCNEKINVKPNPDKLYDRLETYRKFNIAIWNFIPESYRQQIGISLLNDARALNFFVYDLTEPSNKQTTSLEQVNFINNHVYHFAYIDAPYSYSHIAVLEDGKFKVFSGINCPDKGDRLEEVLEYLNGKLKNDRNKKLILKRVRNYRKYGVYASFEGKTELQCQEVESVK